MIHRTGNPDSFRWRQLLALICSLVMANTVQGQLSVTVDRTQISEADAVALTVTIRNSQNQGGPNFASLDRDFQILRQSGPNQSTKITSVNGRSTTETSTSWEVLLRPRRLGQLVIPAFRLGNDRSDPIVINVVRQSAAEKRKKEELVFFDTSVDTNKVYVQGQIIYSIKLYYVENISGDFPAAPAVKDAVVETIENERRYDAVANNRRYYILEKRYAIYPQRSGQLTIPKQAFSGTRTGRGFFSTSREQVMALSEAHTITVNAKPASFVGENWLPAKSLKISESWSEPPANFTVGEPINRTLSMTVDGLAVSLLPLFENTEIEGTKTYKDPAAESQKVSQEGIVSTRSTTIGIVPTRDGAIVIPEIVIPWWNTKTDLLEVARIPSSTYIVKASAQVQPLVPQVATQPQTRVTRGEVSEQPIPAIQTDLWMYVAAAMFLLWLITLLLWWHQSAQPSLAEPEEEDNGASKSDLYRRLITACKANQAATARNLLFIWGKAKYPTIDSTRELAVITHSEALTDEIKNLETCLYSPNGSTEWDGANLLTLVEELNKHKRARHKKAALVEALNPV